MSEGLRVERDGAVTTVVLDRPGRLNALSYDLIRGLARTLEELRGDPAQRVVLLTGAGRASARAPT
jgi:enoyl-CoA hydratase/carnithine racemase